MDINQAQKLKAETDLINAQKDKLKAEVPFIGTQEANVAQKTKNLVAEELLTNANIDSQTLDNNIKDATSESEISRIKKLNIYQGALNTLTKTKSDLTTEQKNAIAKELELRGEELNVKNAEVILREIIEKNKIGLGTDKMWLDNTVGVLKALLGRF